MCQLKLPERLLRNCFRFTTLLLLVITTTACSHRTAPIPPYLQVMESPDKRFVTYSTSFSAERKRIDARKERAVKRFGKLAPYAQVRVGLALSGGGIRSAAFQLGIMSGLNDKKILKAVDYISAVSGGSWAAGAFKSYSTASAETHFDAHSADDDKFFASLDQTVRDERTKLCDDSIRKFVDPAYFICKQPGARILLSSYKETLKNLKKTLNILDPLDKDVGFAFQEAWRAMIQENFLLGRDIRLKEVEERYPDRPYLILNATHSEENCGDLKNNFPFQFTSDTVGTIADCGNTHYCALWSSRYLDRRYLGVFHNLQQEDYDGLSTLRLSHALAISGAVAPVKFLGMDLNIMDWHLEFPLPPMANDMEEVPYRKRYTLADGGHSENLGALALLERNIDVIVISDGAFDPDGRFEDYEALKSHAKALFNVDIVQGKEPKDLGRITGSDMTKTSKGNSRFNGQFMAIDGQGDHLTLIPKGKIYDPDSVLRFNGQFFGVNHFEEEDQNLNVLIGGRRYGDICGDAGKCEELKKHSGAVLYQECLKLQKECRDKRDRNFAIHRSLFHGEGYRGGQSNNVIWEGYFTNRTGPQRRGKIIYVKPPKDLTDFFNYLLKHKYDHIYNYLSFNKGNFPCDKTFAVSYHNELIQAYYLLGKFIGEAMLADKLDEAVKRWPALNQPREHLSVGEQRNVAVEAR